LSKLRLRVAVKPLEIVVQKRWVGRRFVTAANTIRLPPYTVDDLSMRWRRRLAPSMEMQVFLSAVNLFDSDYEITERAPQPGRHVRIGLELNR
jgi:outer membrane receptor protein involved in Fe transport